MAARGKLTTVFACAADNEPVEDCVHYPAARLSHQQVVADQTLFYQALKQLHEVLGTQYRVPLVMEKDLDLYLLYKQVFASCACGCISRKSFESCHAQKTLTAMNACLVCFTDILCKASDDLPAYPMHGQHASFCTHAECTKFDTAELSAYCALRLQVTAEGGLAQVVSHKKWPRVSAPFQFPTSFTSRSFTLRENYAKLLFDFEQVYFHQYTGPRRKPPTGQ